MREKSRRSYLCIEITVTYLRLKFVARVYLSLETLLRSSSLLTNVARLNSKHSFEPYQVLETRLRNTLVFVL